MPNAHQRPILKTKLHIPTIRRELVCRPRLIERLDQGRQLGRRLTLISAPAGFGKTTLLSEWIHRVLEETPSTSVAWLSLDPDDNELVRFMAYLSAALQTIEAGRGQSLLEVADDQRAQPLPTSSMPSDTLEWARTLLTTAINQVAAFPGSVVLVLDDYHLITVQSIHDAVAFLLEHLPGTMHLVVATRADPPLPVARLRGRGQLTELRQSELRFTEDEVATFLNQAMGLHLLADDIALLASRTEGWIAGLQMAALALQSPQTPRGVNLGLEGASDQATQFVRAFAGSNRYILDYLIEEVLQRQPESTQSFLLQTSVLNRLTGPLCDAILDQELGGQQTLEHLERTNLFVIPLDDRREWYRYHRLFADLLRGRLHQINPDLALKLHMRASLWHEQNGQMIEAIEHAFSGQEVTRAAQLVEQVAQETLMRSEVSTLLDWIERLPYEQVCASPSLCLYHTWALLLSGRSVDEVESRLQELEATGVMFGQVTTMRAFLASIVGEIPRAAALSRQVLDQLPEDDRFLRSLATWISAFSMLSDGDYVQGIRKLREVAQTSQENGNIMVAVSALTRVARTQARQGQLAEAKATFEQAIAMGTDRLGQPLPVTGRAMISLGDLLREWNDLDAAERYLVRGIELIERWRRVAALPGYIGLTRLRQSLGDMAGASQAIQMARQLAVEFDAAEWDDVLVEMYQARLWIVQGNMEAAVRWAQDVRLDVDIMLSTARAGDGDIQSHLRRYAIPVKARLLIRQGRPEAALGLLAILLSGDEQRERRELLIEAYVLRALALHAQGNVGQAASALERALSLAEPGGYVRIFVDEGAPMGELLRHALSRGITQGYVRVLLDALEGDAVTSGGERVVSPSARGAAPSSTSHPLTLQIEPLTERELQVLRLLAAGLSNKEIAEALVIAVGTAKKHLKGIYDKLDVHSRTQAVARAQDLGIL